MAIVRKLNVTDDFKPFAEKENAAELLARLIKENGFSRDTDYLLNIVNILIENGKEIFKRIPSEVLTGLHEGGRRNVEASYVARSNESPVRPDQEGLQEDLDFGEAPFLLWDKQERALEAWARHDGCWYDNAIEHALKHYGGEIDHGTEAHVFHYDDSSVVKVVSSMFDPQETLDRISLTNFIAPATNLELLGLGRGEDGELCFIVKQPFIQGKHIEPGEIEIKGLDQFECVNPDSENPEYMTPYYLLGDLHDRNLIQDDFGNVQIIDCNLFLNTPELGRGGQWVIPQREYDEESILKMTATLARLTPRTCDRTIIENLYPDTKDELHRSGQYEGFINIRDIQGNTGQICVQIDPRNESKILWNTTSNIYSLIKYDKRFSMDEIALLAHGKTVSKNQKDYRFDLDRGRIIPKTEFKLQITEEIKKEKTKQRSI